mmetsp:Transcript_6105/g.12084  ORF Transcript_6105/g.12084 Transcript_6105/m.12084 type:complete len:92 (-) Transcript_6105:199-474(-)
MNRHTSFLPDSFENSEHTLPSPRVVVSSLRERSFLERDEIFQKPRNPIMPLAMRAVVTSSGSFIRDDLLDSVKPIQKKEPHDQTEIGIQSV